MIRFRRTLQVPGPIERQKENKKICSFMYTTSSEFCSKLIARCLNEFKYSLRQVECCYLNLWYILPENCVAKICILDAV